LTGAANAQVCGIPGNDGPGGTLSGVINTYYPGTATISAGATSIPIGAPTGAATAIAAGDLLLVIQVQDAAINSSNSNSYGDGTGSAKGSTSLNNSGKYEYVVATGPAGGTVSIKGAGSGNGLVNTYTNADYSGTQGERSYQVVRVPQYSSATLGSSLTASPWNGSTGGILVFDVTGALSLGSATVSLDGMGFRGGGTLQLAGGSGGSNTDYRNLASNPFHASKGEGIAGTPRYVYDATFDTVDDTGVEGYPNGSTARGAPGNAGGGGTDGDTPANDENSGGGGGANGGPGGVGGNTWNSDLAIGGYGGAAVAGAANRMVLGGGGGGGTRNNSAGTASSGAAGGGIVMIRAGSITGSATISANGSNGNGADNDGGGGGGAGGSVLVLANTGGLGSLTVNAKGGNGGSTWLSQSPGGTPGNRHGPGGGGGGGFIATSSGATTNVTGGSSGLTTTANDPYGATGGGAGSLLTITASQVPGASSGNQCIPVLTTTKSTSTANVTNTPTGTTATYTITVANAAGKGTATNIAISDTLPASFTYNANVTVTLNGGATRPTTTNPTAGAAVPSWSTFALPGSASVVVTFTVNIAASVAAATYQNPATATYTDPSRTTSGGTTTSSYNPASSTAEDVTVVASPSVGLVKSVTPNGSQAPGTDLAYTIVFTNAGGRSAVNLVITDPIPANTDFKVGSVTTTLGTTGLTVVVAYSKDGGTTWTYTPASGAGGAPPGYDRMATNIRWTFTGNLSNTAPNNSGSVGFTSRIR
jgi:uncharacterized repeat protein (TIGR01451 family)/fimbrial isopeptide formation D2 family protein